MSLLHQLAELVRSPRIGTAALLVSGRFTTTVGLVVLATAVAALNAARVAADVSIATILYGGQRIPAVNTLVELLGRDRTAIVLYLVERSWDAVLLLTAVAPAFYWLLGSAAIGAAARMQGRRRPARPLLIVLGYAVALTQIPADLAALVLGSGPGLGPQLAQLVGTALLILLGVIAWRAIQAHYGLPGRPALRVLGVAVALFYLVPFAVIVLALVAIVVAAIALGYVPGL